MCTKIIIGFSFLEKMMHLELIFYNHLYFSPIHIDVKPCLKILTISQVLIPLLMQLQGNHQHLPFPRLWPQLLVMAWAEAEVDLHQYLVEAQAGLQPHHRREVVCLARSKI